MGAIGYAPGIKIGKINPEQKRYRQLWEREEYRQVAPGESMAMQFLAQAKPKRDAEVIDFGCGTGRGGLMLALLGGLKVKLLDFAPNCLDAEVAEACKTQPERISFATADLTQPIAHAAAYGYCTDVMEHIPTEDVQAVLRNILSAAHHVYFCISTQPDHFGATLSDGPLHLTVKPLEWWLAELAKLSVAVHWSQASDNHCEIYCSAWIDGPTMVDAGIANTEQETIRSNVKANLASGWEQVNPHTTNDIELMIIGGGPTLAEHLEEIRDLRAGGAKLIALNGAYNWCLDNGITPSGVVVVDAREFNARFTHPVVDGCKYFIASQCDPKVLEGLPKDRTYLWHTTAEMIRDLLEESGQVWWGIPGGSTVLLRTIPLFRMLGFRKFHLYGCDSCIIGTHHAYQQPENDDSPIVPVTVSDGRVFYCHPWMVAQAQEFMDLIRVFGDEIEIEVHGDGLLAHILETGAKLAGD